MKWILYISAIIGVVTYLFWESLPKGSFYIGNALFIFGICTFLFLSDKKSFIKFFLFCISLNNLIDELFLDNTKLQWNEIFFAVTITVIGIFKYRKK